ncbi:RHS repeat-associated protein [Methylobacterium fujisawaense]|uniref:RHS repeat-associated protein n=1 Tax=Methylobacterium fujisawaense TaxID=107400 RepID=A0ABR6DHZ1_9HYPH|nr:RHS repeat-associated protein [Methylobacterium fujisawaense]
MVTDHLGTPRELVDEDGAVHWAARVSTWGVVLGVKAAVPAPANDEGGGYGSPGGIGSPVPVRVSGNLALRAAPEAAAWVCPIRFQGQWADAETGLYYNRHRHYDPVAGQYASPDPIGLAGGDRPQGYVKRPSAWIDPLGLAQRLQAAVDQAVRELEANPQLARELMSPGSYRHLVVRDRLAAASYGKAVERRAAQILGENEDPTLRWAGRAPKGPDGRFMQSPDFFGANGATYDITTAEGIGSHLVRPYGPTATFAPHPGLPPSLVFPP